VCCRWWRCMEIVRWRQFENELNLEGFRDGSVPELSRVFKR